MAGVGAIGGAALGLLARPGRWIGSVGTILETLLCVFIALPAIASGETVAWLLALPAAGVFLTARVVRRRQAHLVLLGAVLLVVALLPLAVRQGQIGALLVVGLPGFLLAIATWD